MIFGLVWNDVLTLASVGQRVYTLCRASPMVVREHEAYIEPLICH
jgi:hypothetical protein